MKKFYVNGSVEIGVTIEVEAETKEEAIEKAYEQMPYLQNFCGNGGTDQIVGVYDKSVSLCSDYSEPTFTEADEKLGGLKYASK